MLPWPKPSASKAVAATQVEIQARAALFRQSRVLLRGRLAPRNRDNAFVQPVIKQKHRIVAPKNVQERFDPTS